MAEAKLNFDENALDKSTGLYDLYSRLYLGMDNANKTDPPSFVDSPPLDDNGNIDVKAIQDSLHKHSEILMKNSAYMMANAIMSSVSGDGSGGSAGIGFVSRAGDNMTGALGALYGFQAGTNNVLIFETNIDSDDKNIAHIHGSTIIDDNVIVSGKISVGNDGIFFSNQQSIFYKEDALIIQSANILIAGSIEIQGSLKLQDVTINNNGLFYGIYEYYHGDNSNKSTVNWDMKDAHVYGNLIVDGNQTYNGRLSALKGFDFGEDGKRLLYSILDETSGYTGIKVNADLSILSGYGIKFDDKYIVRVRGGSDNVVSFSAPGKIMNLGDSDNGTITSHIALQTAIKNYNGDYTIVSQYGDGNFKNSLSAGCANAGPTVLQTYYSGTNDCGVIFHRHIRLGSKTGSAIYGDVDGGISMIIPYQYVPNISQGGEAITTMVNVHISCKDTTSLFKDLSSTNSSSLSIDTESEFFSFGKPVESNGFSIISENYKTRLIENALFFSDNSFIEGIVDGIRYTGNAYFANNISSMRFASGFAGYGWSIIRNELSGNVAATFDELTIRKKMRIYELEVQKQSITNGSLWVSDACSGDLVEELV